jgi:hypothetical protein
MADMQTPADRSTTGTPQAPPSESLPSEGLPSEGLPSEGLPSESPALKSLQEEIRRRFGAWTCTPGSQHQYGVRVASVLSTGCPSIDALLPDGGIPRGRLTEISGSVSSGKTSLVQALAGRTMWRRLDRSREVVPCSERGASGDPAGGAPAGAAARGVGDLPGR